MLAVELGVQLPTRPQRRPPGVPGLVLLGEGARPIAANEQAEAVVECVFDGIIASLRAGQKIELRGFGSFRLRKREPRKGRNPKTGDKVDVPPKSVPYFKPGKELKDLINREPEGPFDGEESITLMADLDAGEYNSTLTGEWTRGLLIRRNIAGGDLAFFSTWCPKATPIQKLVLVEGHRWAIEDSFETAKNELGLDHNESRSWHGWHRHVSLVMLAFAMTAIIRHRANAVPLKKTLPRLRAKPRC